MASPQLSLAEAIAAGRADIVLAAVDAGLPIEATVTVSALVCLPHCTAVGWSSDRACVKGQEGGLCDGHVGAREAVVV